jgi:hypothetical protein
VAKISINEAAKKGFKSRSQINKDVRSGKVPHSLERGRKVIDVADLVRLYGEPGGGPKDDAPETPVVAADVFRNEEIEQLRAEKARLETELREARDSIKGKDEAAAKERDRFMGLLEDGNKRLEDLRQDIEKANKPSGLSRFLQKLFDEPPPAKPEE